MPIKNDASEVRLVYEVFSARTAIRELHISPTTVTVYYYGQNRGFPVIVARGEIHTPSRTYTQKTPAGVRHFAFHSPHMTDERIGSHVHLSRLDFKPFATKREIRDILFALDVAKIFPKLPLQVPHKLPPLLQRYQYLLAPIPLIEEKYRLEIVTPFIRLNEDFEHKLEKFIGFLTAKRQKQIRQAFWNRDRQTVAEYCRGLTISKLMESLLEQYRIQFISLNRKEESFTMLVDKRTAEPGEPLDQTISP